MPRRSKVPANPPPGDRGSARIGIAKRNCRGGVAPPALSPQLNMEGDRLRWWGTPFRNGTSIAAPLCRGGLQPKPLGTSVCAQRAQERSYGFCVQAAKKSRPSVSITPPALWATVRGLTGPSSLETVHRTVSRALEPLKLSTGEFSRRSNPLRWGGTAGGATPPLQEHIRNPESR